MLNPQLVAGALQMAAHMAQCKHEHDREVALAQLRNSTLSTMVDALVNRRVDAVQAGFNKILDQFADQARHLMTQQSKYADAELAAPDARRRIELQARVKDVDGQLALIRTDAQHLYERMTEVVMAIGGRGDHFAEEFCPLLQLRSPAL